MRLRTFLLLDLIGSLLWIAFCVGLGYAIGQSAVDVAKAISRYALYLDDRADRRGVRAPVVEAPDGERRAAATAIGSAIHGALTIVPRTSPSATAPARPRSATVSPSARNGRAELEQRALGARARSPRSCPRRTGRPGARRRR